MDRRVDLLCQETARLRGRWDALRSRLDESLFRLRIAMGEHVKIVWKVDSEREGVRRARLSLRRERLYGRDIREVFSNRKPQ